MARFRAINGLLYGWRCCAARGAAIPTHGCSEPGSPDPHGPAAPPAAAMVDVVVRRLGDAAVDPGGSLVRLSGSDVAGRIVQLVLPGPVGARPGGAGAA